MLAGQDLIVLLAIAFFIFGAKKLPEVGSSLGKAMKDFKDALDGVDKESGVPNEKLKRELIEKTEEETK